MTEAFTATTKAKSAKHSASPFDVPNYSIPTFDLPNMEIPKAFRQMSEKGVAQAKDTFDKAKAATAEATDLLKDTYATASKGAADYNLKVIENVRTNTATAFDYAHQLLGVKFPSDFIVLSTEHARKQYEVMIAQAKELTDLAQKVTAEITEPLKAGATRRSRAD
jgi:phasin